jgi:DNA-binding NarL/FixJ family response regulator
VTERIRVMVVDDHLMVRRGLATFLDSAPDLEVVAEATGGAEAVRTCAKIRPDVVLLDLKLPELDGISVTRAIRAANPEIQVIAMTSSLDDELVSDALNAGAVGFLLKYVGVSELRDAIRAAMAGRPTLAPEATRALVRQATSAPRPVEPLTAREREVLSLMVRGLRNAEIANHLIVSRSTVNFHVSRVLGKLEVTSRTAAVRVALRGRLVDEHAINSGITATDHSH